MSLSHQAEDLKRSFDDQGFVVISEFFTADEVEALRREIERYVADVAPSVPRGDIYFEIENRPDTIKQLIRMNEYDAFFGNLLRGERFSKLAETLLGGSVVGKNMQWFNKPAGLSRATPPHQDGYYFMLEPNEALTMWLALDEVGEDNGCVRYVSGSHREGLRAHERTGTLGFSQGIPDYGIEEQRREVAVAARPGDLLVHHSLMIHRADANTSERKRRALGLIYYSAAAREDVERLQEYQRTLGRKITGPEPPPLRGTF